MASGKDGAVIRQLRTLFNVGAIRELTDGQLLERFSTGRGEAAELAFAVLLERHGPMVLRVCRGVLVDTHDTQDAFQATFLVLVRKARGLWVRDSLGPWLHQVAYRTASCARSAAARRHRHERGAALSIKESRAEADDELGRVLHEEIDGLPERYRAPLVLCDLEGRSHTQTARHLGWPVGTVKSRLARGRQRLRDRLVRRGLAPGAGLLAAAPRLDGPAALVPDALVDSTASAAVQFATVGTIVPGFVAFLAQGVVRSMIMIQWLKIASVVIVLGATASGVDLLAQKVTSGAGPRPDGNLEVVRIDEVPVYTVKPGKLPITVVERGVVEASRNPVVFCLVEGRTTIIALLPEGTKVKEAQLVGELDSSALQANLKNQKIATLGAYAAYENAKLTRDVAEKAAIEYAEGILKQQQQKPPAPQEKDKREVLEKYLRDKTIKELQSEVEKAKADELAKEQTLELEKDKEAKLDRQIKSCKLYAPGDGVVVYANDPSRFGLNRPPQIAVGATVRERQLIFRVPDPSGPMWVNTKVHEAKVDRIKPGLRARIEVDAFADLALAGTAESINPFPDPRSLFNEDFRIHTAHVTIDKGPSGLRPGMTAQVEILVNELDNVLSVPIVALVRYDGKDHVAVKKPDGGFDWREVTLGVSNDTLVEVRQGIQSGEVVALKPLALLSEQEKRKIFGGPTDPAAKPGVPR